MNLVMVVKARTVTGAGEADRDSAVEVLKRGN